MIILAKNLDQDFDSLLPSVTKFPNSDDDNIKISNYQILSLDEDKKVIECENSIDLEVNRLDYVLITQQGPYQSKEDIDTDSKGRIELNEENIFIPSYENLRLVVYKTPMSVDKQFINKSTVFPITKKRKIHIELDTIYIANDMIIRHIEAPVNIQLVRGGKTTNIPGIDCENSKLILYQPMENLFIEANKKCRLQSKINFIEQDTSITNDVKVNSFHDQKEFHVEQIQHLDLVDFLAPQHNEVGLIDDTSYFDGRKDSEIMITEEIVDVMLIKDIEAFIKLPVFPCNDDSNEEVQLIYNNCDKQSSQDGNEIDTSEQDTMIIDDCIQIKDSQTIPSNEEIVDDMLITDEDVLNSTVFISEDVISNGKVQPIYNNCDKQSLQYGNEIDTGDQGAMIVDDLIQIEDSHALLLNEEVIDVMLIKDTEVVLDPPVVISEDVISNGEVQPIYNNCDKQSSQYGNEIDTGEQEAIIIDESIQIEDSHTIPSNEEEFRKCEEVIEEDSYPICRDPKSAVSTDYLFSSLNDIDKNEFEKVYNTRKMELEIQAENRAKLLSRQWQRDKLSLQRIIDDSLKGYLDIYEKVAFT